MISEDTILARDSEPIAASVGEEVFILSIRAGAYFGFNAVGSEIWKMLAQPRRVGELYAALAESFDVDLNTIAQETSVFLNALLEQGLIRSVDPERRT
jgi:hypothetical protein